jgi:hypothetical protein
MNKMTMRQTADDIVESKFGAGERDQLPVAEGKSPKGTRPFGKMTAVYRKVAAPVRKVLKDA